MLRRLLSNYSSTHNGQRAALLLILTILLSLGISSQIGIVRAATITVTQNDDAGDGTCDATCTLPEAILQANFNGGGDTIEFAVNGSGSAETIFLTAPLPDVQVQVTIDGSTQGGGGCSTPPITIDGTPVGGDGLVLGAGADGSSIQGLNITKFGGSGIVINGASNNLIQCNSLSANSSGVNVVSGSGNTISQNSIFSNAGAGITLGGGANGGQTAPALTLAQSDGATGTTVTGTLTSTASSSFTIEFFQCDSTPDEGQTPIGTTALGTDGAGAGAINISSLASLNVGDAVSATATNTVTGDTSRFSACEPVVGKPVYQSSPAAGGSPLNISTNLGTPASTTINITNLGNATLNITGVNLSDTTNFTPIFTPIFAPTPPFSVTAGDVTIGVNIEIQCNALAVTPVGSPVTTTLTVPNNAGPDATYTIECDVAAAAAPDYDSVPPVGSTIAFGPVTVGSSGTFSLEIDSVGTDILNVSNPTITGANAGDFSVLSSFPINISGSNSVNVSLRCAPTGLTGRSANLAFTTNSSDPTETTVNYPLTCTGIAPVITMTPTTLTDAYEGQTTYSQIITASGGTPSYTLVETGALPTGMTFVGGVLSGTPAAGSAGTYNFTITATDSLLFSSAAQPYTLIVRPPIVVTPVTLPNGTVGVSYIQTIGATGGSGVYSNFAVTVGSLPPPLILNAGSGSITGTPSTPGTFPFSVTVTDSLGATGTLAYSVTINPGITVTPATLPNGTQGIPYTQTIGATGGSGTYTNFAVTIGSLPAPLILNAGSGAITGTPTTAGTFPFTVTVTDSLGGTGSQAYSVTINSAITVTPATLPGGTIGTAYNQTIGATGGSGTYTDFSVTAGSLPPPLLLNAGSGAITGTPTTTGTFPFTVTVTDSLGATGSLAYSVTINPAITVTPATLPNGTVGVAFNQTISATGGSGTYSNFAVTAGSLPAPLTLDATTGAITGTPPTAGTFPFTVTVTDSLGATGVQPYNLTIDPGSIVVQPATLPNGTVGVVYSQTISAIGGSGTYTDFSVTAGSLPPPLNLDPTTGAITGTPPTAGTFPFTVTVTDSLGATGVQPYSVTINPAITVTPATLPNGTVGVAYNQTISATGGSGTYSNFAVTTGSLPAPLTLDATTGAITGTPPTAGTFPFTVTVTDSLGATGVQPYNLTIDPTAIVVTPPTLPGGSVGVVYNQTISATGGSGSYTNFAVTAGSLPPPLNLDPITGALTGTPTTAGTFPFTVTVTDSLGATGVQPYSVTINSAITVTPATLPNGMIGIPYNQTIGATGGSGTYNNFAISAGSLPPPLTLDPTTGAITGTPTTIGTFPFSVTVTDSLGATGVQPYSVTIDPAALALQPTVTTLPNATQGTPYPFNFSATGGTPGYTFASTTLPAVLSLATNGALSGTPTATGTFTFDVTVTDSAAATDTKTYTLTVDPTPVLSLQPLAGAITSGTQNVAYTFSFTALGGTPGYTFTTPGPLPAGVTLATDGTLSGTPTASGTFTFSVTVADSTLPTALTDSKTYSLTINPTGTITLGALPNGAINVPYSATITVTPTNTYTFAVTSGTLPTGLTLSTAGVLSGTPTTTSSFTFTVQATSGAGSGTKTYTIIISQPIYVSSPGPSSTINVGTVQIGTAISANLVISNNGLSPATLAVTRSGALITGLNAADFALTNLPSPFNGLSIPGKVGSTVSSQTITIRCIPSANGLRIATLTFTTNDPTKPTVTYALACTGSGTAVPTATPAGFLATATAFVIPPTEVLPATGSVVEVKGLAMRTGPYLGATLIGKAIPGAPYSILARSNDEGGGITWYLITTVDGVTGWVSGLYLNVTGNVDAVPFQGSIFDTLDGAPDTGISARAMSIIDIRRRPSGRAAIIGQVPQDGTLHLMGRTRQNGGDFWVQVNYNGIIGWIPAAPISVRGNTGTVPIR